LCIKAVTYSSLCIGSGNVRWSENGVLAKYEGRGERFGGGGRVCETVKVVGDCSKG